MISSLHGRVQLYQMFAKGGVGAEFGVRFGDNALRMVEIAQPMMVHLVDDYTMPDHLMDQKYIKTIMTDVVMRSHLESGIAVFHHASIEDVVPYWEDEYLDWAYYDARHDSPHVERCLDLIKSKVKIGGLLCGHDFVTKPGWWGTDTCRSVIDLVQSGYGELVALTNQDFPDWAIRRLH